MPKSKKPKKQHRPLAYKINPISMLRDHSTETLSPDQLRDLMVAVHSSLDGIKRGMGTEHDIVHLAVASNIALVLAENGMGPEFIPEVKDAQRFIVNLQTFWNANQRAVLSGPAMIAIERMLELHDAQVNHPEATEGVMVRALKIIFLRMQAGNVMAPS